MRRKDMKAVIARLIFISIIWLSLAYLAIANERYWLSLIPFFLLALTIRNQLAYVRKNEPEIIDADQNAQKGLGKIIFGLTAVYAVIATFLQFYGHSQDYITWFAWLIPLVVLVYLVIRVRKLRNAARKKIEERESRDKNAQGNDA
jgi:heme exporter protein D